MRLLVAAVLAVLGAACDEPEPTEPPTRDPRVAQLRHWVAFRRASDNSVFFLGRFELREEQLARLRPEALRVETGRAGEPDLPAAGLDIATAAAVAAELWGRLPRFDEWRSAVEGPAGYRFPWGEGDGSRLRANTWRLGLGHRTRVGTFESGRDFGRPGSCYDLFGNVAEWTLTPWPLVQLDVIVTSSTRPSAPTIADLVDQSGLEAVLPRDFGVVAGPWSPASPFIPELAPRPPLGFSSVVPVPYCSVGFSYDQRLPLRHEKQPYWVRLGVVPLAAGERRWDVGVRVATDPYTFLSRLEQAPGQPVEADREPLRRFLAAHAPEFRRAARQRAALPREALGLPAVGPWARLALEILGAR